MTTLAQSTRLRTWQPPVGKPAIVDQYRRSRSVTEYELDDVAMTAVREAVDVVLAAYEPYPTLVVDGRWQMVARNRGVDPLTAGAHAYPLDPPVNVLRLSLHPDGAPPSSAEAFLPLDAQTGDRLRRQLPNRRL